MLRRLSCPSPVALKVWPGVPPSVLASITTPLPTAMLASV